MTAKNAVRDGSIYLQAEDYERYFSGLDAVVVLIREGALHILPVQQLMSGGHLLKIRNANGDRVISAPDVFAEHDRLDWVAYDLTAQWIAEHGALVCPFTE